ncbi:FeoA domain-containing protein [Streptococcus sciuri]|uniref:FeoA domain-containing protein n=1 Tax=Streptococcus sciuri TaxID=2973939 RepID=A0ABT2F6S4_9STRE|nr:FeoA domain-containing protein [Streptococcus sciuri]MCS4488090.1 FeoA domain-containing protein [Streptococcus sciuri]
MILQDAKLEIDYEVLGIDLPSESVKHLSHLGLTVGSRLRLVAKTKRSAIMMIKGSRLAFDSSITSHIDVVVCREDKQKAIPLSKLPIGSYAYVEGIYAVSEARRRLMDMGLTRHTKLYLRKVAPLGDPLELTLRGYELTLRKSEANLIAVLPSEKGEEQ